MAPGGHSSASSLSNKRISLLLPQSGCWFTRSLRSRACMHLSLFCHKCQSSHHSSLSFFLPSVKGHQRTISLIEDVEKEMCAWVPVSEVLNISRFMWHRIACFSEAELQGRIKWHCGSWGTWSENSGQMFLLGVGRVIDPILRPVDPRRIILVNYFILKIPIVGCVKWLAYVVQSSTTGRWREAS